MTDATQAEVDTPPKAWIYAIGIPESPQGPVKIGRTMQDVEQRLLGIQRADDASLIVPRGLDRNALKILFATQSEWWIERRLHLHFSRYRVCGEWFALDPAVVAREVKMAISEIMREVGREPVKLPPLVRPERSSRPKHGRRTETKAESRVEPKVTPVPAPPTSAKRHMQLYKSWVDAGFTEDQALRMVAMLAAENR